MTPRARAELLVVEQVHRVQAERRCPTTEEYVRQYPELGTCPESLALLAANEFELRRELGETLDVARFVACFPTAQALLMQTLALGTLLPAPLPTDVPTLPPGYTLQRLLGRGANGVVYLARDDQQTLVAVKLLLAADGDQPRLHERFRQEAATIAALQHPNIAPLLATGVWEGRPYLVTKYIPGVTLDEVLPELTRDFRRMAQVIIQLAHGLHHAHERGVIHRDLKPKNIMVDTLGQPVIIDFGLARFVNDGNRLTQSHDTLGTPAYIAPEQALHANQATLLSDVYSLGAILYHACAGRPPFQEDSVLGTLQAVLERPAPPVQQFNPKVPDDLGVLALKCLEKVPEHRLRSAHELAAELQRWSNGETILSRPPTRTQRLLRRVARHPVQALFVVLMLVLLPTLTVVSWVKHRQTQEATAVADEYLYSQFGFAANEALLEGKWSLAEQLLASCAPDRRSWEWHYLNRRVNHDCVRIAVPTTLHRATYSSDSQTLWGILQDGTLCQWNAQTGAVVTQRPAADAPATVPLYVAKFSPDGTHVAWVRSDSAHVWVQRLADGHSWRVPLPDDTPVHALCFARSNRLLVVGDRYGLVRLVALATGHVHAERRFTFRSPDPNFRPDALKADRYWAIRSLALDEAETTVAVGGPWQWYCWQTATNTLSAPRDAFTAEIKKYEQFVETLEFRGNNVAVGIFFDPRIPHGAPGWLWPRDQDETPKPHFRTQATSSSQTRSPSGHWFHHLKSPQEVVVTHPQLGPVLRFNLAKYTCLLAPNDGQLAACNTVEVRLWSLPRGQAIESFTSGEEAFGVALHPQQHTIVCSGGTEGGDLHVWDRVQQRTKAILPAHTDTLVHAEFSPDGSRLVTCGMRKDATALLWDTTTWTILARLDQHERNHGVLRAAFHPDGTTLLTASEDGRVLEWSARDGTFRRTVFATTTAESTGNINSASYSPDGQHIAVAERNRRIVVLDARSGQERASSEASPGPAAWSPDGQHIVYPTMDLALVQWDWQRQRPITKTLFAHKDTVRSIEYTADGRRILTASADKSVKVWDTKTGTLRLSLTDFQGGVSRLSTAAGGTLAVAADWTGTIRLFDARP